MLFRTLIRTSVLATLSLSFAFSSQAAQPRLIQVSPTQKVWMQEGEIGLLSKSNHEAGRCAGFLDVTETDAEWALVGESRLDQESEWFLGGRGEERQERIVQLVDQVDARNFNATIQSLSNYHTRHAKSATGVQAAEWIAGQFREMGKHRSDVTVELVRHRQFNQPSVRARIQGAGPNAAEVIVIGGHEDSTNQNDIFNSGRARAPGADDDASGVATVLEVFRVLVESNTRPDRTIEFMTYAGEEIGLLGSQDIALDYKNRRVKVVGALQFDMTMVPGPSNILHFVTDFTSPAMNDLLRRLTDLYVGVRWSNTQCGYGCSDHASWNKAGFPSAIPFESSFNELNRGIHTERDVIGTVKPDFGAAFAKLGVAFVADVAGEVTR